MKKIQLLIFIFLLISCSEEENQGILGSWEWQKTTFHFRGGTPFSVTPNNTDTVMIVNINPETIKIYKNNMLFGEFEYLTIKVPGEKDIILIDYKNKDLGLKVEQGPIYFENKKLVIAGGYNDAGGHQVFIRKWFW